MANEDWLFQSESLGGGTDRGRSALPRERRGAGAPVPR